MKFISVLDHNILTKYLYNDMLMNFRMLSMDCAEILGLHFKPTCVTLQCNEKRNANHQVIITRGAATSTIKTFSIENIVKTFYKNLEAVVCHPNFKLRRLQSKLSSVADTCSIHSPNNDSLGSAESRICTSRSQIYSSNVTLFTNSMPLTSRANTTLSSYYVSNKSLLSPSKLESSSQKMLIIKIIEIIKKILLIQILTRITSIEGTYILNSSKAPLNFLIMKVRKVLFAFAFCTIVFHFDVVLADQGNLISF